MSHSTLSSKAKKGGASGASEEAIQAHYDVSTDFYRLWLDPTMTYSAALWSGEEDSLHQAQLRKLDFHIRSARAANADYVLDIGCGWGSTLRRMREHYGVKRAVGLTLSKAQLDSIQQASNPGVTAKKQSWEVFEPEGEIDAIVSIGAFEHFARNELSREQKVARYRAFFERCYGWLRPNAYLSLQTIVHEKNRRGDYGGDFLSREIFPESELPHLSEIIEAVEQTFEIEHLHTDRLGYLRTLRAWEKNLKAKRSVAFQLVGENVYLRYQKYLRLCMIGFHQARINLSRMVLKKLA